MSEKISWTQYLGVDVKALRRNPSSHLPGRKIPEGGSRNQNHLLCKYCALLFDNWNRIPQYITFTNYPIVRVPFHDTLDAVRQSALHDCPICAKFISIDNLRRPSHEELQHERVGLGELVLLELSSVYHFHLPSDDTRRAYDLVLIWKDVVEAAPVGKPLTGRSQIQFGNLENSTAVARQWLDVCQAGHIACRQQFERHLPTRLLRIDGGRVRLYTTRETDQLLYTTLSHCWGGSEFLVLKAHNFQDFQNHIPYEQLTRTFRDAIDISRELGYAYIWIDSLCIIQDDDNDWTKESGRMANVYSFSDLNIAATAASDGTKGCIFSRDATPLKSVAIEVIHQSAPRLLTYKDPELYHRCLTISPLFQRAWCLQERLLAPRTLHFAQEQLFWECNQAFTNESAHMDGFSQRVSEQREDIKQNLGTNWDTIVSIYTSAQLSFMSDKAVALAGIAQAYAQRSGHRYLAGLWEEKMSHELCWAIDKSYLRGSAKRAQRCVPKAGFVFPSWSWLSIHDARVFFVHDSKTINFHPLIKIVHTDLEYDMNNKFANVRRGLITIDMPSCMKMSWRKAGGTNIPLIPGLEVRPSFDFDHVDMLEMMDLFLVPITDYKAPRPPQGSRFSRPSVTALILQRSRSEIGRYRRVGITNLYGNSANELEEGRGKGERPYCLLKDFMHSKDQMPPVLEKGDVLSESIDDDGQRWYRIVLE